MKVSRIVSIALTFGLISYGAYAAENTVTSSPSNPNPATSPATTSINPLDQFPTSINSDDETEIDDETSEEIDDAEVQLENSDDSTLQSDDSADDESDFEDD